MTTTPTAQLVDRRFVRLVAEFDRLFRRPGDGGGALTVYLHGEPVVDVWAGYAAPGEPWRQDTVAVAYSTGKGVAATLLHRLAERGLLDYDKAVAEYWPEFAAAGKDRITVRELLSHRAGLHRLRGLLPGPVDAFFDDAAVTAALAAAAPDPRHTVTSGYHGISFGHLVAELVRRVGGDFTELLRTEIAEPLGAEELWFRVPESQRSRIAPNFPALTVAGLSWETGARLMGRTRLAAAVDTTPRGFAEMMADPRLHDSVMPGVNGVFSARALARLYGALANGGSLGGYQLLRPETIEAMRTRQVFTPDYVLAFRIPWGLGFHGVPMKPSKAEPISAFGHFGLGGSGAFADPATGMSLGFVTNRLGGKLTPLGDARLARLGAIAHHLARDAG
ncbi:beta-lactamase family protein [Nocardia puris]|uniref:serine hydrolase domain-containing protein n=1 Tax=Nocardia puris TaxID=208602 RepID=UPI0018943BAD|nr:serine hydrolase domain-containing protein [Nocardia puris]MBF6213425.1 beta-lactamase family protein [Nocardia puris]MBF6369406.1 beta-lactamase family protein [Nocardia puris]MBF6462305.1 beta-lactamase family protein [Nocardia puris]